MEAIPYHAGLWLRKPIVPILLLCIGTVLLSSAALCALTAPIVYRTGHQVFILVRRVRLPLGAPASVSHRQPGLRHAVVSDAGAGSRRQRCHPHSTVAPEGDEAGEPTGPVARAPGHQGAASGSSTSRGTTISFSRKRIAESCSRRYCWAEVRCCQYQSRRWRISGHLGGIGRRSSRFRRHVFSQR